MRYDTILRADSTSNINLQYLPNQENFQLHFVFVFTYFPMRTHLS